MDSEGKIIINLPDGRVFALRQGNLIRARGVKYSNAGRFEYPHPTEPWTGIVDCTKPGQICPQNPSRLSSITGSFIDGISMDEDCLRVSVTAPWPIGEPKPVMVWFHGGAYVSGGGDVDCYNPAGLASRGVVVVNVTHRLGVLGYLFLPGVAPANLGLLDQIAALKWVKRSISSFGGDPSQVTVFGQSAGGDSIFCMMGADNAEGLFQRAVFQSTPFGQRYGREELLQKLAQEVQKETTENLRTVPVEDILRLQTKLLLASKKLYGGIMAFGPYLGHDPLPEEIEFKARIELVAQKIPILVGWTADEGRPFAAMLESVAPYFKLPFVGHWIERLCSWILMRQTFKWPSQQIHRQFLRAGGSSASYAFKWAPSESPFGASHCMDLPFLLGDWTSWKTAPMLQGPTSREVIERVGEHVKDLWVEFSAGKNFKGRYFDIGEDFAFER